MWFRKKTLPVSFTNTLTGKKEAFEPLKKGRATLYSCGPTVYGPVQIGNLRSFVLADLAARALSAAGYDVKRVMNVTDVGHMVGDGDEGEDKMTAGAKRDQTSPEAIAKRYTDLFLADLKALNVDTAQIAFPRATGYIPEQIAMTKALEDKGYTYTTSEGVYFDTAQFPEYGMLGNRQQVQIEAGARVAMGGKRSPHDFVLWRTAKPHDLQKWPSPWGEGNPGWSIECSAMATALLGPSIDVHTGGEDLASIHHNNEIAQSEGATGKRPFVRYWLHGAFLTIGGEKLSKSAGNSFTLADIVEKGIHPLALRYLFLQAHYRSPLSFSWDALMAADTALQRLWKQARSVHEESEGKADRVRGDIIRAAVFDDLGTPAALDALWRDLGDHSLTPAEKWGALEAAEETLGLGLRNPPVAELALADLPQEARKLAEEREQARKDKDFQRSDELRIHLERSGYAVEDAASGTTYTKKKGG